jgi:hypothetical protein
MSPIKNKFLQLIGFTQLIKHRNSINNKIPDQIWALILINVNPNTILKCKYVCKQFKRILSATDFWKSKLIHDFNHTTTSNHYEIYVDMIKRLYSNPVISKISNLFFSRKRKFIYLSEIKDILPIQRHVIYLNLSYEIVNRRKMYHPTYYCTRCNDYNTTYDPEYDLFRCNNCYNIISGNNYYFTYDIKIYKS